MALWPKYMSWCNIETTRNSIFCRKVLEVKLLEVRPNNFYLVRTTRISEESMDPPWSLSNTLKIQLSLSSGFVTLYPDKYQTMSYSYDVFAVLLTCSQRQRSYTQQSRHIRCHSSRPCQKLPEICPEWRQRRLWGQHKLGGNLSPWTRQDSLLQRGS